MPGTELQDLLVEVRGLVAREAPQLQPLYEIFAAEAVFGRQWLLPHLARLPAGARLLEVGAGLMLLSCQLAREGYAVTALEPVGQGFSDFHALQHLVRRHAEATGVPLAVLPLPVERLRERDRYEFAFSINVMEHVDDVEVALRNITRALRPGAAYAFTCPNYRFPYEPHFGLPIVGSKRLTERIFARAIRTSKRMPDPLGLWRSLNWITVGQVRQACRQLQDVEWRFDRAFLATTLARITRDEEFAKRHSAWLRRACRLLVATGLHRLAAAIPAPLQPVIDCTLVRKAS